MLAFLTLLRASLLRRLKRERQNSLAEKNFSEAKYLQVKHQEDQIKDFLPWQTKPTVAPYLLPRCLNNPTETKLCQLQRQTMACHLRAQICPLPPSVRPAPQAEGLTPSLRPHLLFSLLKKSEEKKSWLSHKQTPFSTSADTKRQAGALMYTRKTIKSNKNTLSKQAPGFYFSL